MSKRLIAYDEVTGLRTWHDYDASSDETQIGYDCESKPIIELNKAMQNDTGFSKKGIKDEFWLYASIPADVQMKFLIEDGIDVYNKDHTKRLLKKLADPEYRYLKCTTGKHL